MKTNKWLNIISAAAIATVLMGCPYTSTVPLSNPTVKVSDSFVGTWEKQNGDGATLEISKASETTMKLTEKSSATAEPVYYMAHFTDIAGTLFVNVKEDSEYSSYNLYKIEKQGDFKIVVSEVTPYIKETFDNSDAMKKFFEANMKNSYFFTTEDVSYFKVK